MEAKNKWNGRMYDIVQVSDKEVTLRRASGSIFTIQRKEFDFNYIKIGDKNKKGVDKQL